MVAISNVSSFPAVRFINGYDLAVLDDFDFCDEFQDGIWAASVEGGVSVGVPRSRKDKICWVSIESGQENSQQALETLEMPFAFGDSPGRLEEFGISYDDMAFSPKDCVAQFEGQIADGLSFQLTFLDREGLASVQVWITEDARANAALENEDDKDRF